MFITLSKVIGLAIGELQNQSKIGEVDNIVFNKDNLSLVALTLKSNSFLPRNQNIISAADIIQLADEGVVIANQDDVTSADDLVRVKKAIKEGYLGCHQKVVTETGRRIGHVYDFLINAETLSITKLYVKNLFSERVISVSAITGFNGKVITVKDDFELTSIEPTFAAEAI